MWKRLHQYNSNSGGLSLFSSRELQDGLHYQLARLQWNFTIGPTFLGMLEGGAINYFESKEGGDGQAKKFSDNKTKV